MSLRPSDIPAIDDDIRLVNLPMIQEVVDEKNFVRVDPQPVIKLMCSLEGLDWERWMVHIAGLSVAEYGKKIVAMDRAVKEAQR